MARSSLLSDELVRQLVAVGQVDILVGLPTFNHAATVEKVVRAVHVGLAKHFPRERTVLINPDGGSADGTPEVVRNAPLADEELRGSSTLRTTHRVSAPYAGIPDQASGVRVVFAAADLLQARAVAVIDPAITSVTPEWVAALVRPVYGDELDFVLPIHPRHRFEGPLLTQLVRPLLSTAFGRRLRSNVAGDFGCSGRFAAGSVPHEAWDRGLSRPGLDVWLAASALADEQRVGHVHLGPCELAPGAAPARLPDLFLQVVGSVLSCLEWYEDRWLPRTEAQDLPVTGEPQPAAGEEQPVDPRPMAERFRTGLRDLAPLLRDVLAPETLAGLQSAAAADQPMGFSDRLWARTVYEFAAAHHRGVMSREHLIQTLVPLYLGRVAALVSEEGAAGAAGSHDRVAALQLEFEQSRPYLIERWTPDGGR